MWLRCFLGLSLALAGTGLLDVAQKRNDIVFDDDDNESGAAVASIHDDPNPVSEADATVDNWKDGEEADETIPEKAAEPPVSSEMMQTFSQVQPKRFKVVEQWPSNGMHLMKIPGNHETPRKVQSLAAMNAKANPRTRGLATQAQLNQQVTEEYDDEEAEGESYKLPSADEQVATSDGEPMTYEDLHRKKHGDVDKIVAPRRPKVKPVDPPEWHPPPPASQAPQNTIRVIPGGPYVPGAFALKNRNLRAAFGTRRNAQARMKDQCMAYTNWLKKAQGPVAPPMGPKILQMMKSTCDPAIRAGVADSQYTLMCNSLGSAVEPFLVSPATDWGGICDAVIRVFNEAGIGQF